MAVAHRASAKPASVTNTTSATLVIPASVVAGDVLFVISSNRDANAEGTLTDNDTGGNTWTSLGHGGPSGAAGWGTLWWKRATSGSASKTVTLGGQTGSCSMCLSAFSGALASGNPYEAVNFESNASSDATHAGFTPSVTGTFVCLGNYGLENDTAHSTQSTTDPGALTELIEHLNTGGTDCSTAIAGAIKNNVNATGNFTWNVVAITSVSVRWAVLPDTGGGSTYNESSAEVITVVETTNTALVAMEARAEALTVIETVNTALVAVGARAEILAAIETISTTMVAVGARDEVLTAIETQAGLGVFSKSLSEVLTVIETQSSLGIFNRTISETLVAADTQTGLGIFERSIAEILAVMETEDGTVVPQGNQTYDDIRDEILSAIEIQSAIQTLVGAGVEVLVATDTQNSILVTSGNMPEVLAAIESQSSNIIINASIAEILTIIETQSASIVGPPPNDRAYAMIVG